MIPGCAVMEAVADAEVDVTIVEVSAADVVGVAVAIAELDDIDPVPIQTARAFSPVRFENNPVEQSPDPIQGL